MPSQVHATSFYRESVPEPWGKHCPGSCAPPPHPPVAHVAKTGAVELLAAPIRGYAQSLYHRHPKLHVQEQVSDGTDSVGILNAVLLS